MAVYTHITRDDLNLLRTTYGLGEILSASPIAEGVENSNYLLRYHREGETDTSRAILTIFEQRVSAAEVPFFLQLTEYLRDCGLTCPAPYHTSSGEYYTWLLSKPAALVAFLEGASVEPPAARHCEQAGAWLATMHRHTQATTLMRPNRMGLDAWGDLAGRIAALPGVESHAATLALIQDELAYQHQYWPDDLPRGIIHGDLFPNNVFFDETGEQLVGVIDFYFACDEVLAYDLAVTANAWCADEAGALDQGAYEALLAGYQQQRVLSAAETEALPTLLRAAALRFLVTRLHDLLTHEEGSLVTPHDPQDYVRILRHHRGEHQNLSDR